MLPIFSMWFHFEPSTLQSKFPTLRIYLVGIGVKMIQFCSSLTQPPI